jgi:UrcA family protein
MKYTIPAHCIMSLAVTGVFFGANLAVAQEEIERIIIRAPYERIEIKKSAATHPPFKTEIVELKRLVNINDLDLTKTADVTELNSRIESVAKESCQKLSDMFPLESTDPAEMHSCERKAIASARKQIEQVIAEAN